MGSALFALFTPTWLHPRSSPSAAPQAALPLATAPQLRGGVSVWHDLSPALRDIPIPANPSAAPGSELSAPLPDLARPQALPNADPYAFSQIVAWITGVSFEGVSNLDRTYPPDTNGDVGLQNYVQMVNLHFAIYSKDRELLYGLALNSTLWQGLGTLARRTTTAICTIL